MIRENLIVFRGGSQTYNFTLKDNDGNVIDISTATILMTVKEKLKDANADATFTKAGAITVAASGTYSVSLTPTETAVPADIYHYDIVITIGSDKYQGAQGLLHINQDVGL